MFLQVVLVLFLPCPQRAEVFTLSSKGAPHLLHADPSPNPILWYQSAFAFKLASSEAVRINSRGVRFVSGAAARDPLSHARRELRLASPAWTGLPCRPGGGGSLCTGSAALQQKRLDGNSSGALALVSRIFPVPGERVVVAQHSVEASQLDGTLLEQAKGMLGSCPPWSSFTGRSVQLWSVGADGNASRSLVTWDVSSCNALDAGVEYVFLPHRWELHVLDDPMGFQLFLVISLLSVALVIVLARNLERSFSWGSPQSNAVAVTTQQEVLATGVTTAALFLVLVLFSTGAARGAREGWVESLSARYITAPDRLVFRALCLYVSYYLARLFSNIAFDLWFARARMLLMLQNPAALPQPDQQADGALPCSSELVPRTPVNPILGTLGLVALKIYGTAETPYIVGIVFLLATRLAMKVVRFYADGAGSFCPLHSGAEPPTSCPREAWRARRCFAEHALLLGDVLGDAAIVGVLGYLGFAVYFGHSSLVVGLYALQGLYAVLVVERLVRQGAGRASSVGKT